MRILDNLSLNRKMLALGIVLVVLPVLFIGSISFYAARKEILHQTQSLATQQSLMARDMVENVYHITLDKVKADLTTTSSLLDQQGRLYLDRNDNMIIEASDQISKKAKQIRIAKMKIGNRSIVYDYALVDRVQAQIGGTATIFQVIDDGLLRISTNVLDSEQKRAVGTYIPSSSPVYQAILSGEIFYGRAFVVNSWYLAAYKPIKEADGTIIGALYFGVPENYYQQKVKAQISEYRLGDSGYIFIVDGKGKYELSFKRHRDGENIWESKDSQGNYFIQNMISDAKNLAKGSTLKMRYPWINEKTGQDSYKLAFVSYFSEWDWYVGASIYEDEMYQGSDRVGWIVLMVSLGISVMGILSAMVFGRMIATATRSVSTTLSDVAHGNIKLTVDQSFRDRRDEMGDMIRAVILLVEKLADIIGEVKHSADTLRGSSSQMNATAGNLSENIQNQAAAVEEISATMEELSAGMDHISNATDSQQKNTSNLVRLISEQSQIIMELDAKVSKAQEETQTISDSAKTGELVMQEMRTRMNNISQSSEEMTSITSIINGISEQINLLSLNAAIEAARAGESGRGFAVVADEISKLADQTASSIKDINSLLNVNQNEIQNGSMKMVASLQNFNIITNGVSAITTMMAEITKDMKRQLDVNFRVNSGVKAVSERSSEISSSTNEQKQASDEVVKSVSDINEIIQTSTASAEELSQNASELENLANKLQNKISYFH